MMLMMLSEKWLSGSKLLSHNMLRDREIVLAAVQKNPLTLQLEAESCRGDPEIVLAAVKQDGRALRWASE
eukprot:797532-Amphidinium_carterae.1